MKKDWRNDRESKRQPSLALYCPPHQRKSDTPTKSRPRKFRLEVELQPNMWWKGVVKVLVHAWHMGVLLILLVHTISVGRRGG